jgi:hypothetical protein
MKGMILLLAVYMFIGCAGDEKQVPENWRQLFNGKDLTGWQVKISGYPLGENFANTFRVEDGILKASYAEYEKFDGEFGHLFYNEKLSNYKLRIEYRIVGEQVPGGPEWGYKNNGVMLHSQSAESMGLDQDFPVSIEAQFLGGNGTDKRPTANVCTPGTHVQINDELVTQHCNESTSPTFHGTEWVAVELVVKNDQIIHHLVNGDTVMTYTKPVIGGDFLPDDFPLAEGTPLTKGYIALQAESHPFEFRKVELLNLK